MWSVWAGRSSLYRFLNCIPLGADIIWGICLQKLQFMFLLRVELHISRPYKTIGKIVFCIYCNLGIRNRWPYLKIYNKDAIDLEIFFFLNIVIKLYIHCTHDISPFFDIHIEKLLLTQISVDLVMRYWTNYWIFGHYPSSCFLFKTTFRRLDSASVLR
jgi:hypothetical protein